MPSSNNMNGFSSCIDWVSHNQQQGRSEQCKQERYESDTAIKGSDQGDL